ncbi:hypothetical protein CSB93_6617 (plasmid) [Pseudomonas paraeruginosa]|uniref:Uncharacterized protein n=1 Tax=Pseudomonas paraeruginosa TaxID=2994495 RepID=A0A2R3J5U6_9PSED|nr:hypothetical protein CSB93_6617 [Pseudomonas paraeruginosa]AWE95968.1 hypothetical protein CSC28_6822 [Pseudomonas paraeruginosa]
MAGRSHSSVPCVFSPPAIAGVGRAGQRRAVEAGWVLSRCASAGVRFE